MKHSQHSGYRSDAPEISERALLTIWPSLADLHDELVLVGGLVPRYICTPGDAVLPAVTMDVDLGIALGASTGQYEPLSARLRDIGFNQNRQTGRFEKTTANEIKVWLDFLTEARAGRTGSFMVDDVVVSGFAGIDRALKVNRTCVIKGLDFFNAPVECRVRVAEVGPYLVLKLIAFDARATPKDAFDVYQVAITYDRGPRAAIAGFGAEKGENPGYERACASLRKHFSTAESLAAYRCAAFCFGEQQRGDVAAKAATVRQDLATFAQFLLGA